VFLPIRVTVAEARSRKPAFLQSIDRFETYCRPIVKVRREQHGKFCRVTGGFPWHEQIFGSTMMLTRAALGSTLTASTLHKLLFDVIKRIGGKLEA